MDYLGVLKNLFDDSLNGIFGDEVKASTEQYQGLSGFKAVVKTINDICQTVEPDISQGFEIMTQMMIVAYREAKRVEPMVAEAFMKSLVQDFPGTHDTALTLNLQNLIKAALLHKNAGKSKDPLLVERSVLDLFQEYNEFLNKLLGYLIICWKCHKRQPYNIDVFGQAYGQKLTQLEQLSNGDNGPFYLFLRLGKRGARNGAAHGRTWIDRNASKICFRYEKKQSGRVVDVITEEIPLIEFLPLNMLGAELGRAYIAATAIIFVLEHGCSYYQGKLPSQYIRVFNAISDKARL